MFQNNATRAKKGIRFSNGMRLCAIMFANGHILYPLTMISTVRVRMLCRIFWGCPFKKPMITRKPKVLNKAPSVTQSMNHFVQMFFQFFFGDFFFPRRFFVGFLCRCCRRPSDPSAAAAAAAVRPSSRSCASVSSPAFESFSTSRSSSGIDSYFPLEEVP